MVIDEQEDVASICRSKRATLRFVNRIYSLPEVARELGVSVDRVRRTAAELGMRPARAGSARNATMVVRSAQRADLRAAIGVVPTDRDGQWSRADMQVLAALAQAPRGLVSARAVARRAGVSPATALKSLSILTQSGLVYREADRLALGRVRDVAVYRINRSTSRWRTLAPRIAGVHLPVRPTAPLRRVPNELLHLFWNTHWSQLDLVTSSAYVARRLVAGADLDGLAWGSVHLDEAAWKHAAQTRGITARRRRLAENIAQECARDSRRPPRVPSR